MLSFLRSKSNGELNSFAFKAVSVLADGSQSRGLRSSFTNGVWIDKPLPLKASFKEIIDNIYMAMSMQVDFQTKKAVEVLNELNSWAEKETNGPINEALPAGSVDSLTGLIFANALHFKGTCNKKFDASKNKEYDFYLLDGGSVHIPFMTSEKKLCVCVYDGFKVLKLPYSQGEDKRRFSMYFFLPDSKDRLPALAEKVASEPRFLDRCLPSEAVQVGDFRIPKFKISFRIEVSEVLKGLGLVLPFSVGRTEMSLCISSIFHKSYIELVNKEGTEATSTSVVVWTAKSYHPPTNVIDFVADHPFMYLIREDMTEAVLFIRHVLNPLQAS
ncbi:hypothetical protein NE237_017129 [Protea cynaroides]|uniref:Serpin domain-containing protein n=1 Tax=Protea cynaroides TaxID=273540 RepID=A0A9Q0QMJ8_9MAGN|nr:hypothetical protein NE237_017129 [Protea cynaroides]